MIDSILQIRTGLLAQMTGSQIASWIAIGVVLFIIFANKGRGNSSCQHRGWGTKFVMVLLLILGAYVFVIPFVAKLRGLEQYRARQIHQASEAARQVAMIERQQMERARQMERAQTARTKELAKNMSMHQLWESLHKPRIQLDRYESGAMMSVADGAGKTTATAPSEVTAAAAGPQPQQTSESLSASLARLEQVIAQATAVADRVSEAGTLMGRAMIVLNETIDARSRVVDRGKANDVVKTVAATETQRTSGTNASAEAASPPQRTVEIKFDANRLRQEGLSFDRARAILGRDGFWRGRTVRFNPQEHRIAVTGAIESQYESRLADTLLGTSQVSGRVIHVNDVAEITPKPDALVIDAEVSVTGGEGAGRPAWVDSPPKRVGNTWREVVVAGEYATRPECDRAADVYLMLTVDKHLQQLTGETDTLSSQSRPDLKIDGSRVMVDGEYLYLIADEGGLMLEGNPYSERLRRLMSYGIGIDFVRREIAKDEYLETVERSFGPMMNLYTLVEFTPSVDSELLRRWNEYRRDERLLTVGAGAGSVLGLIGLAFGLLKVDTWTKGYYSKRLFLGVPAAIIGVLALLSLLGV